jgi:succinate dehydrogenase / fumarate reductase cytochrome b subunit
MEVVLMLGLLLHIYQGYNLWVQNQKARPEKYAYNNGNANSKWYSRSMGLLGTLLLMFLIIHLSDFWIVSRFTGIEHFNGGTPLDAGGHEDLYAVMYGRFREPWRVILYVLSMISL